tara:strand:+ start:263 stop:865 length:603 start_codon:yes stop_codon:yes gene_type:complete
MELHIGSKEAPSLADTKLDDINTAFANLEKCKQASTSKEGKQQQQEYFNICESEIGNLERIIEIRKSEIENLERIGKNMNKKMEEVKESHQKSIAEQTYGKTARSRSRSRSKTRSKTRSKSKSRSRSRDREEEDYPKEERILVAKVAHLEARRRYQESMRQKTGNTDFIVSQGRFDKLPNQGPYYNPNPKTGGRTRRIKR